MSPHEPERRARSTRSALLLHIPSPGARSPLQPRRTQEPRSTLAGQAVKAHGDKAGPLELTFGLAQDPAVQLLFLIFQEGVFPLQVRHALEERGAEPVFKRAQAGLLWWALTLSWLSANALLMSKMISGTFLSGGKRTTEDKLH